MNASKAFECVSPALWCLETLCSISLCSTPPLLPPQQFQGPAEVIFAEECSESSPLDDQ